jgi:hypothetical protein
LKQVVPHIGSDELALANVPTPIFRPPGALVRSSASLVSSRTQRPIIDFARKSLIGKAHQRPDVVRKVGERVRRDGLRVATDAVRIGLTRALPSGSFSSAEAA